MYKFLAALSIVALMGYTIALSKALPERVGAKSYEYSSLTVTRPYSTPESLQRSITVEHQRDLRK